MNSATYGATRGSYWPALSVIDQPSDKFSGREILRSIRSLHVIIISIVSFMNGTCLFGLALFLPSIVSELGFSRSTTQLLSVGPFALGVSARVRLFAELVERTLLEWFFSQLSYTHIIVRFRPLPIERYRSHVDYYLSSCGVLDTPR